jgi:hypothetical protein
VDTSCPVEPFLAFADRVRIRLKDGRELDTGDIRFARGNAKLPLSDQELERKFRDCTADAQGVDGSALYARLASLDSLADARNLMTPHR